MNRNHWRRPAMALISVVIPAAAMLNVGVTPAQAYSCSRTQGTTVYQSQGVAHADLTLNSNCTDGQMHWSGVVYDDLCDGRAGEVDLVMDQWLTLDHPEVAWIHRYTTSNGCGTRSTFSGSDFQPGSVWALSVQVGACNSNLGNRCSDFSENTLYS